MVQNTIPISANLHGIRGAHSHFAFFYHTLLHVYSFYGRLLSVPRVTVAFPRLSIFLWNFYGLISTLVCCIYSDTLKAPFDFSSGSEFHTKKFAFAAITCTALGRVLPVCGDASLSCGLRPHSLVPIDPLITVYS